MLFGFRRPTDDYRSGRPAVARSKLPQTCAADLWFGDEPKYYLSSFLMLPRVTSTGDKATQFGHDHGGNRLGSKARMFQRNKQTLDTMNNAKVNTVSDKMALIGPTVQ